MLLLIIITIIMISTIGDGAAPRGDGDGEARPSREVQPVMRPDDQISRETVLVVLVLVL